MDDNFQKDIEVAAQRYADAQSEVLSLQLQRAFIEGAMAAIKAEWTSRALAAATGAANDAH